MEIRVCGLVLLLVLSAALPADAQSWGAFKKKHIYLNMPENRCTNTIEERKINPGGVCKTFNSFIRDATDEQVINVCRGAGHPVGGNLYESNRRFRVVTCTWKGSSPCRYDGRQNIRFITVACEGGFPPASGSFLILAKFFRDRCLRPIWGLTQTHQFLLSGIIIMEMCWFGLVFLLVLCATLPAEAQPPNVMTRYQRFVNRHVFQGMTKPNCTREIYKRGITDGNTAKCKKVNSFILSTIDQVQAVCGKDTGVYTSTQLFPVITCKLHGGLTQPDCDYGNKARNNTRYITIGCEQGWPVHYKENLSVIG